MERYLIQCPFLGVSVTRDSTVFISVPTVTVSRIFEATSLAEKIISIAVCPEGRPSFTITVTVDNILLQMR